MSETPMKLDIYGRLVPLSDAELAQRVIDAAPKPVDLLAYAKTARDAHENGGIVVMGVPVATDDRSKTLVTGARLRVGSDPTLIESWAATDGHVYPLNAQAIVAISDAIGAFVSSTFAAYGKVVADINAGVITTVEEIEARYGALEVVFYPPKAPVVEAPKDEAPTEEPAKEEPKTEAPAETAHEG